MSECKARLIAFYLPQFYSTPENDRWWGKGFTEWTNVVRAKPLFRGHYQPRIPADLGFYDLRVPETRMAQAEMARAHGIEGFCYWHYWFAGERLLERPFNEVLASGEPRFPFCLAWANKSWTGIWSGAPDRMLKAQIYRGFRDHEAHFYELLKAFSDWRYMTVEGCPIFVIYRPRELPGAKRVTDFWRDLATKSGLRGLHLVAVMQARDLRDWHPYDHGFDAAVISNESRITSEGSVGLLRGLRRALLKRTRLRPLYKKLVRRPVHLYEYAEALPYFIHREPLSFEYYPCLVPNWDNSPRTGLDGLILRDSTPELFRIQVRMGVERVQSMPPGRKIIFVKSWNEWAEGNYLEPDLRFGKKYLEALMDEIVHHPAAVENGEKLRVPGVARIHG